MSLHLAIIHPSLRCNLMCPGCYAGARQNSPMADILSATYMLDVLKENGIRTLVVSGGEPLLYPYIEEFLSHAVDLGFTMAMMTNGSVLGSDEARMLARLNVPIFVSLDFVNPSMHGSWRGRGLFRGFPDYLQDVASYGVSVGIRSMFMYQNLGDVLDLSYYAYRHGFRYVAMRYINETKVLAREPTKNDVLRVYEHIRSLDPDMSSIRIEDPPFYLYKFNRFDDIFANQDGAVCETYGGHRISVWWNGDVYPCPFLHVPGLKYGNLFTDSWSTIRRNARRLHNALLGTCACDCALADEDRPVKGCGGGCVARSYWRHYRETGERLSLDNLHKLKMFDEKCPFFRGLKDESG